MQAACNRFRMKRTTREVLFQGREEASISLQEREFKYKRKEKTTPFGVNLRRSQV